VSRGWFARSSLWRSVALDGLARLDRWPIRTIGSVMATAVAVAVVSAGAVYARSSDWEIRGSFDALRPTEVVVRESEISRPVPLAMQDADGCCGALASSQVVNELPIRYEFIESAGMRWDLGSQLMPMRFDSDMPLSVFAVDPGYLESSGTVMDTQALETSSGECRVAVGSRRAGLFGVTDVMSSPLVELRFVSGETATASSGGSPPVLTCSVVGVISASDDPELLNSIVVDLGYARSVFRPGVGRWEARLRHAKGYADGVAAALPFWLRPDEPASISVVRPPDSVALGRDVGTRVKSMTTVGSVSALLIASVVNAALAAFVATRRTREIALRRAFGASTTEMLVRSLLEVVVVGTLGALLGAGVGVLLGQKWAIAAGMAPREAWSSVVAAALAAVLGGALLAAPLVVRVCRRPPAQVLREA
jgi:hypothetical protein